MLWVGASADDVEQGLRDAAAALGVQKIDDAVDVRVPLKGALLRAAAGRDRRWLLVLDNADSEAELRGATRWLSDAAGGDVLITTRCAAPHVRSGSRPAIRCGSRG